MSVIRFARFFLGYIGVLYLVGDRSIFESLLIYFLRIEEKYIAKFNLLDGNIIYGKYFILYNIRV